MISIIIPTYNHANELELCLASIGRQTYKDLEIIVVDDGSNDNLSDVIKKYKSIKFIQQQNLGAPAARNNGFKLAQGNEVIFVDADVVLHPDCLYKMHKILQKNEEISFVYSSFKIGKKTMKYIPFDKNLLQKYNYIHSSSLIRAKDFPGWDETLKKFQDWDLWLTMTEQGKKGEGIDEILFKIINPRQGTMSRWLPSFVYHLPWDLIGWQPQAISKYQTGYEVIKKKHKF